MLRKFGSNAVLIAGRRSNYGLVSKRCISSDLKAKVLTANESFCKPLSVSEAKKLGEKGEIILQDELLLDRYMEELSFAESKKQVPQHIPYDVLIFFFAARGSFTVANAILAHVHTKNSAAITEKTSEAYIDGLVQFGDMNRAMHIFKYCRENGDLLQASAFATLLYGAIRDGRFDDAKYILKDCEDQFIPPEIRDKIVQ